MTKNTSPSKSITTSSSARTFSACPQTQAVSETILVDSNRPSEPQTLATDIGFSVSERLNCLTRWYDEWKVEDTKLLQRIKELSPKNKLDAQRAAQISSYRRRIRMQLVREPIEIALEVIEKVGPEGIRQYLVEQFARLTKDEKLLWLQNFQFIMTPDLRKLNDKISKVRGYGSLGQQRNFLLGGASGMGKTTYLDWFISNYLPTVQADHNHIPVIKIDAPVSNHTPRPLLQRLILACGMTYIARDNEEDLLMLLSLYFQKCGVEVVIVDEIEHIYRPELRRRLLEISNLTPGVPFICASCQPRRWTDGDLEVAGRWNDYFELENYTGERLSSLMTFIELLLPFTQDSNLSLTEVKPKSTKNSESANFIEQATGGILRDIMILIADASRRAIEEDLPCLTTKLLEASWKGIQTNQVTDFLSILEKPKQNNNDF